MFFYNKRETCCLENKCVATFSWEQTNTVKYTSKTSKHTDIFPTKAPLTLKMIFLFPMWDILVPWREIEFNEKNSEHISGWWLNQPIWKICSPKWESSPNRGENKKKTLKPPPRFAIFCWSIYWLIWSFWILKSPFWILKSPLWKEILLHIAIHRSSNPPTQPYKEKIGNHRVIQDNGRTVSSYS